VIQSASKAQGFDWQYSSRLPFETPKIFFGVDGGLDYNLHQGDFNFIEQYFKCCSFTDGNGIGYKIGLKIEYWASAEFAIFGSAGFNYIMGQFIEQYGPYPDGNGGTQLTEFEFNSKSNYINFEAGIKYRLFLSHFFVATTFSAAFMIDNTNEHLERTISKASLTWDERIITDGRVPDLKSFVFQPEFKLGYDLNMGLGAYSSVYIGVAFPIQNQLSEGDWRKWTLSAGVSVYPFGIR